MVITLVVSSLLFFAVQGLFKRGDVFAQQAYHLEEFEVKTWAPPPVHLSNALDQQISIQFSTKDLTFELDLTLNHFIYDKKTKIFSSRRDQNGNPIEIEKEYTSYYGNATIRARDDALYHRSKSLVTTDMVSVTFYPDKRAHILVITPDDIFTVDRMEVHQEAKDIVFKGQDKRSGMSMARLTDHGESYRTSFHQQIMDASLTKSLQRRNLLIYFDNCWPGQSSFDRVMSIGIIVDDKYYCKVVTSSDTASCQIGGKDSVVLADLQSVVNAASAIYAAQFNIHLRLGTVYMGASAASLSPNDNSCPTMSTQLNTLKAWRATYYSQHTSSDTNGIFHLFTNCHPPPGTVGLAYIGVLCNAASGYSTGIVNRVFDQTWLTFAHEGGHNFGMTHSFQNGVGTTGGIMDYGSGKYQGEYQFEPGKKSEVCQQLTTALSTSYKGFLSVNSCLPQYNEQPLPTPTPSTSKPTSKSPTKNPTTKTPTKKPTTKPPTKNPTQRPTTSKPTSVAPTAKPTTAKPTTTQPTTAKPTTTQPTTAKPTTAQPTTPKPTTAKPTTAKPTTVQPTTPKPTTAKPTTVVPTLKPTPKPTEQPTVSYFPRWYKTGTFGSCYPACGNSSYATEEIQCCASDLSSTNQCNWVLDKSYCDPATKPTPNSKKCTVPACVDNTKLCGNGVINSGEYCDPGMDSCCLSDCTGFRVTNDCVRKNTKVDAAFTDRNRRVYIFQGPYYTRYTSFYNWYYGRPESGYPKTIKGNFPVQQCTQNIAAIVSMKSNQLYVFCNSLTYVKVDLDNQLQLAGVYDAGKEWHLPQDFIDCGQVNAALSLDYYILLFCQNIWISVPYTRTTDGSTTSLQVHSVTEFGFTIQNGYIVTAVMYDPSSGYWAWFQGPENYITMQHYEVVKSAQTTRSIFNNSEVTDLDTLNGQGGCYQDSCTLCEEGVCKECTSGNTLYGWRCFNNSVLAYLECNEGSESDVDLVEGGFATLLGFNYTTGVSGNSLVFDGQTKLVMKPLNRRVTDFSVSAYFKPRSMNQATFVTIDDAFVFAYQSVDAASFQVMVKIGENEFTCYVAVPMKLNEWNKIQVIVKDSIIWTGANGFFHMRAFDTAQEGLDLELNFANWAIGANYNGIDGYLDEFILVDEGSESKANTETSGSTQSQKSQSSLYGLKIWQIALIAAAVGLLLLLGMGFVCYKYVYQKKIKEQLSVNFK